MLEAIKPGICKLIKCNGAEVLIERRATMRGIQTLIGAKSLDTICLTKENGQPAVVMVIDDTGRNDGRPVNDKATALYHAALEARGQRTSNQIYGDVVLVHDQDFA